jgi:hypothetical protein
MNNELAIIIQGPSTNVEELKNAWSGYNLIWSTWEGEESKYNNSDVVILNKLPKQKGVQNIALQKETTLNGINKAKELGYSRVLKWRSDLVPSNPNMLINSFKSECINFLAWHNEGKYFVDYFVEGDIQDIYKIWNIPRINDVFAEKITTENILSLGYKKFNFVLNDLSDSNEIYWLKRNLKLSNYKNEKCYTVEAI